LNNANLYAAIINPNPSHVVLKSILPDTIYILTGKIKSYQQEILESSSFADQRSRNSNSLKLALPVENVVIYDTLLPTDCKYSNQPSFGMYI